MRFSLLKLVLTTLTVGLPVVAQSSNCSYPPSASYFGNLQGRIPSGCYGGNLSWWALPVNGGTLAVNAEACKTNVWYVSVKGEKLNSFYGKEARVAGIQGLTGTPEAPVTKAPQIIFNAGTCSGNYSPFHGVIINGNGLHNFSFSGPMQSSPDSTGSYDTCQLGVYRVEFTPSRTDVGKTFPVKVTSQILVTSNEYQTGSYVRESSQVDWFVNITVVNGANCPTIAVNVTPSTKIVPFGASCKFTAGVSGTTDTRVQWTTTGGGTIDQNGNYLAGNSAFSDTITATSLADPTKSGTAHVTVRANQLPVFAIAASKFYSKMTDPWCSPVINPTPLTYQFVATDPDGYPVTYALAPAAGYAVPSNVSINSSNGQLKWDGKNGTGFNFVGGLQFHQTFNCKLNVVATDPHGGVATYPITLQFDYLPCASN